MKASTGFALIAALATQAIAIPAGWEDAGNKATTTTVADPKTWEDVPSVKTTTAADPKTWEDDDVPSVETTTADPKTWEDVPSVSTTTADPHTWEDVPSVETTTADPKTWEDAPAASTTTAPAHNTWEDAPVASTTTDPSKAWEDLIWTTTVTDTITTYVPKPTVFTHGHDVYTVTVATTLTLTKGPYTISIPVYEETQTVCEDEPAKTPVAGGEGVKPTGAPVKSDSPVSPISGGKDDKPVDVYTGAASKMAGAGLAGVAAIAALLL